MSSQCVGVSGWVNEVTGGEVRVCGEESVEGEEVKSFGKLGGVAERQMRQIVNLFSSEFVGSSPTLTTIFDMNKKEKETIIAAILDTRCGKRQLVWAMTEPMMGGRSRPLPWQNYPDSPTGTLEVWNTEELTTFPCEVLDMFP